MKHFLQNTLLFLVMTSPLFSKTLTLEKLIGYGMEHSTVVKKSQMQVEQAQKRRKESRAKRLGSVDLVGSYTHYNLPRTLAPLTPASILTDPTAVPTTKDLFTTGIAYTVALFTGFSQTRQVEMDTIAEELSKNGLFLTKEQLAFNTASLYLSILALQEMKKAQHRYVLALKKLTEVVEKEVELGKKAKIDFLKAQKELYGNIAYEERLQSNIVTTKAALASLVGLKRIEDIAPVEVMLQPPRYDIDALMERAKTLRRVRNADLAIKKAQKGVQKSGATRYPQLFLESYYGYNYGENDASNKYSGEFDSQETWQVGLSLKWNLFDFGKSDAVVERAEIAKMEAVLQREETLSNLRKSLVEACEKMKQAYTTHQSNLKQYALAKESEKIEYVRYENGVSTINDLLYAKSQSQLAEAKLIESRYDYQKAKFYMNYLLERGVKE